jgi:hypothetical protein
MDDLPPFTPSASHFVDALLFRVAGEFGVRFSVGLGVGLEVGAVGLELGIGGGLELGLGLMLELGFGMMYAG